MWLTNQYKKFEKNNFGSVSVLEMTELNLKGTLT